ncbi:unnamed protein product [Rotaria sp. Silwood1]|nr:unnamed protein product [Rotaria sp. Silwood1]CAF0900352.1 unnamed protein product [Rotaria sp. Silwood1]CAF3349551.1 unnamed protein product [Rotaria sp. Silwood1]CAF3372589.1 unnamed protein product [Rotaria sp. Silwood1]CAF4547021.1 unnamed protein product [Rotaria sp. Silwood1]
MPRPKGSKKDKNKTNKIIHKSLSRSSISSSLLSSQTSIPLLNINYSNDFINDDINWMKTSINNTIINKVGRPKKKDDFTNNIDDNIITTTATSSPTSSSSEIHGGRVVINPAVLRYLEQNRNINYSSIINKTRQATDEYFNKNTLINVNDEKDDHLLDDLFKNFDVQESIVNHNNNNNTFNQPLLTPTIHSNQQFISIHEFIELDKLIQDDLFWDFCTYSTDFLTSARLAQWILTHQ